MGLCAFALSGCAGLESYRDGKSRLERGDLQGGLDELRRATVESPTNLDFRMAYFAERDRLFAASLRDLDRALDAGRFDLAERAIEGARSVDAGSPRVAEAQDRLSNAKRLATMLDEAERLGKVNRDQAALGIVRQVLSEVPTHRRAQLLYRQLQRSVADTSGKELGIYPKLRQSFRRPVSLTLTNASLIQTFEALKQTSGLNFMFDREVKQDLRVTLSVAGKSVEDVLRLILVTNQLDKRILDEDTLLIYPNSSQKARDYQELVVRSFYLSHADIAKAATLLRTIGRARDVFVDEKLNMLVVRDTADVIRLCEKLLANEDLADPEVVLELEVMEVSTSRLTELGIRWPDSISAAVRGASGTAGSLTLPEFRSKSSDLVRLQLNDPLVAAQLRGQSGDSNLLANPRIRVRNRQTAKILIGERVPVITTTATANVGTSESINYLDVGLKLELEPSVSLDDEVSMRVALEVSNILDTITRASGTQAYRLGTRNASTQLRVHDGETQILAGLIQRDERKSTAGVPYASEVPVLGRLFGAGSNNDTKTEIVLLITPRVVRNIEFPPPGQIEFLSGTETATGASPIQLSAPQGVSNGQQPSTRVPSAASLERPSGADVTPVAPSSNSPPANFVPPPLVPSAPSTKSAQP